VEAKRIKLPLLKPEILQLRAGDTVLLNGALLTARDAAHKRLITALAEGTPLPVDVTGETIFYVGPTPTPPGKTIGAAGPTTSSRMDSYTPKLLALGLKGMIGKGQRGAEVVETMVRYRAIYFAALGGAGSLMARSVRRAEVICYSDLGAEAIRRMEVEDFPVIVAVDAFGNDLYQEGRKAYCRIECL
jgi:fumarate hydratase subunit beta